MWKISTLISNWLVQGSRRETCIQSLIIYKHPNVNQRSISASFNFPRLREATVFGTPTLSGGITEAKPSPLCDSDTEDYLWCNRTEWPRNISQEIPRCIMLLLGNSREHTHITQGNNLHHLWFSSFQHSLQLILKTHSRI